MSDVRRALKLTTLLAITTLAGTGLVIQTIQMRAPAPSLQDVPDRLARVTSQQSAHALPDAGEGAKAKREEGQALSLIHI